MCLIVFKPANKRFPFEYLQTIYDNNPHGFGMMWAENGELKVSRGLHDLKQIKNIIRSSPKSGVAYHFRYRSRGDINMDNVHPLEITPDAFLMHNGTFTRYKHVDYNKGRSDTHMFCDELRTSVKTRGLKYTFSEPNISAINKMVGVMNKVIVLYRKDERSQFAIFNQRNWTPFDDILLSNRYSLVNAWRRHDTNPKKIWMYA